MSAWRGVAGSTLTISAAPQEQRHAVLACALFLREFGSFVELGPEPEPKVPLTEPKLGRIITVAQARPPRGMPGKLAVPSEYPRMLS